MFKCQDLTKGGKPPATADDDDGLRTLRGSGFDEDSLSVPNLLPLPLTWDKFCTYQYVTLMKFEKDTSKIEGKKSLTSLQTLAV